MLPYPAPLPTMCLVPLFPLSKCEALLTALQNGHGPQMEEMYWREECSDFFFLLMLAICIAPYLLERGNAVSLIALLGLYRMGFRISP